MSDDAITSAISAAATSLESSSSSGDAGGNVSAASDAAVASGASNASATPAGDVQQTDASATPPADGLAAPEQGELTAAEQTLGNLPLHRHKAVLTNLRNKQAAEVKALNEQLAAFAPLKDYANQPDISDRLRALHIAENNPDVFIRVLKQDPRYAALLNAQVEQPTQKATPATPPTPRPGPDLQDEAGNQFYSREQVAKLAEFDSKAAEERFKAMLDERMSPIEKSEAQKQQAEQQRQMWGSAVQRQKGVLADARTNWPRFTELESDIKGELSKDPRMTLETAYRRVAFPKFQTDRDSMRKSILAELQTKPGSVAASTRPGAGTVQTSAAAPSLEDQIAAIARGIESRSAA